ncbi:O-antigen ligase family protein [Priestia megaterium]|uniref:O-antigen ligase family protein n=1 Tax=Priestia megaterium TaxID=1404 RepID=UPI0039C22DC0
MVDKLSFRSSKELLLCILCILYALGASLYHPIILAPLVFLFYFFMKPNSFYLYTLPLLSVYLIFIPFAGANFNISFAFLTLLGSLSLILSFKAHLEQKVTWIFLIYIAGLSVGLFYASNMKLGMKLTIYNLLALLMMLAGQRIASKFPVEKILRNIVSFAVPIGIANIIFLIFPNLEIKFLQSSVAQLFIDPGALKVLFEEGYNNILDPRKAGTFFVNTNVAAVFFGMLFWISLSLKLKSKGSYYNFPIIIYFLALLSTNSRAGLGAVAFTVFILILMNIRKKKTWLRIIILSFPVFIIGVVFVSSGFFNNVVDRLSLSAIEGDPRMRIWSFALSHIDPIIGLGYGGWEKISYQMGPELGTFPPHNHFLIVWSWSGILGVMALAILIFGVLYISTRRYIRTRNSIYIAVIGCYATVLFQGMFDNYFLHNYNIAALLFLITGLILYIKPSVDNKAN